jgi:hypothetical protein
LGQNLPQGDLGSMSGLPPRAAVERTSVDCPKSPILVIVAIRGTGGYGTSAAPYSGLMFAVRMTFAHFSVSPARNFPNSAGELGGSTNPPRSTRRALMAESDRLEKGMAGPTGRGTARRRCGRARPGGHFPRASQRSDSRSRQVPRRSWGRLPPGSLRPPAGASATAKRCRTRCWIGEGARTNLK